MTWWQWVLAAALGLLMVFVLFSLNSIPSAMSGIFGSNKMELGSDFTQTGNSFEIVDPHTSFNASDPFAYVVILARPVGTTTVNLTLTEVNSGGAESVVYTVPASVADPGDTAFANKVPTTGSIMDNCPPGTYALKLFSGNTLLAQATFTYLG